MEHQPPLPVYSRSMSLLLPSLVPVPTGLPSPPPFLVGTFRGSSTSPPRHPLHSSPFIGPGPVYPGLGTVLELKEPLLLSSLLPTEETDHTRPWSRRPHNQSSGDTVGPTLGTFPGRPSLRSVLNLCRLPLTSVLPKRTPEKEVGGPQDAVYLVNIGGGRHGVGTQSTG